MMPPFDEKFIYSAKLRGSELSQEAYEFCQNINTSSEGNHVVGRFEYGVAYYWFTSKDDALMFGLKFGGKVAAVHRYEVDDAAWRI